MFWQWYKIGASASSALILPSQSSNVLQNGAPSSVIVASSTQPVPGTSRVADTTAGSVAAYVNVNTTPAPRNQFLNTWFVAVKTLKGGNADFEEILEI